MHVLTYYMQAGLSKLVKWNERRHIVYLPDSDVSICASCQQKGKVRTEPDHLLEWVLRVQVWLHFS